MNATVPDPGNRTANSSRSQVDRSKTATFGLAAWMRRPASSPSMPGRWISMSTRSGCAELDALQAAVEREHPDVGLTDIKMPPTNTDEGIRMAEALRSSAPSIGVVVLSQYADAEYALALLDKGAAGRAYLLKERVSDLDQLVNAIREVARGGSVVDTKVIENLIAERSRNKRSALADLTHREREVLAVVAEGKNNDAIAKAFRLPEGPVEKHVR